MLVRLPPGQRTAASHGVGRGSYSPAARPEASTARPEASIARPEASIARPEASIARPRPCEPDASGAQARSGLDDEHNLTGRCHGPIFEVGAFVRSLPAGVRPGR